MNKYKVTVSKDKKKYVLILSSLNEHDVRDKVHKDGYTILNLEEIDDSKISGKKFIFKAKKEDEIKKGKVLGTDIFKIFLKLKNGLGYEIIELYSEDDKNLDDVGKRKIISDLEDQYIFFTKNSKVKKKIKNGDNNKTEGDLDNFYMKKELDEIYKLIGFVLEKLEGIIENKENLEIDDEKRQKLQTIYNSIIKIKKTTNISKLKQIGELALTKIGYIELYKLENNKGKDSRKLLNETNGLLKKIGSSTQFVEKDKDLKYQFNLFIDGIKNHFKEDESSIKKNTIDKKTYSYLKTNVLLSKYKNRLNKSNENIYKNIKIFLYPFGKNKEERDDILFKRKVIKQNISLLKAKLSGKSFSYTKIRKGFTKTLDFIFNLLKDFKNRILFIIFIFNILFLLFINLNFFINIENTINFDGIFYFIILNLVYILITISKSLITFLLSFVFLSFIIIFWVINF